jgi:hypothetical protein
MIPLGHGSGGSFDELLLLAGGSLLTFGIVRAFDKKSATRRRSAGIAMIVAALGLVALPIFFRFGAQPTAKVRIASGAQVEIISPSPGALVRGSFLDVVVRVRGGKLVPATTTRLKPDEGHLHLSVDERLYSMTQGEHQRVNLNGMTPGEHLLQVEFVALDHGPFNPPVIAVSTFTVDGR